MTLMQQLAKKTRERRAQPDPYTGPDKSSANGNRPLTFPTPYHGGKRRWAEQILAAFGDERECVYVEPFSGSAAVLLANPRPFAREILCDTNPHISNVFRCLAWAPEATAFWADWPTTHQDLTARHTWLLRWAVDHVADIEADPDFHDPKAAGWWLWGKSNWIGSEFGIVRGLQSGGEPTAPDHMPLIEPKMGGQGVQAQRYDAGLPVASDWIPKISAHSGSNGAGGVSTGNGNIPVASDKCPTAHRPSGVSAQVDKIPHVKELTAGRGVSAQRHGDILYGGGKGYQPPAPDAPVSPPDVPALTDGMRGSGVSAQRRTPLPCLPTAPQVPCSTGPVPLTGDRLRPWFQALAQRLYRVIILNRGWKSGLTPTVLQQTRTARKPPVRVLIDPPYKGVGKLYGMSEDEADELAIASWRWAAENGSREGWRIAYACREGDFDDEALALGWTCSKTNITANLHDSTQEVIWFSPHCLRPGQQRRAAPGEQGRMFETGE